MTNNTINNQPQQRSKVSLILIIITLVILVLVGSYLVYGQGLDKTTQPTDTSLSNQTNQDQSNGLTKDNNQLVNNQKDTRSGRASPIPEGWLEYRLSECGIKIYLPKDWSFKEYPTSENKAYSMISSAPERLEDLKMFGEGYPSLQIICYSDIKNLVNSTSSAKSISTLPTNLEEALNIRNPHSDVFYNIFDFGSKPEKIILNNQTGFQGVQGGLGATLNRYFEHNGKIIEIRTDNFDQDTLELDETDRQIQKSINFIN